MSEIKVKANEIVVPGEELATGMDFLPGFGTYRNKETIVASRLGVVRVDGRAIKLTPLSGRYVPKKGDTIICKVVDITFNGWRLDTNSAYSALLNMKDASSDYIEKGADLTQYFDVGDYLVTTITQVTSQKMIDTSMKGPALHKLKGGRIIEVNTNKVPRIIGKQGSMISIIKKGTNCKITVGQNGLVWIQGAPKDEIRAVQLIKRVERDAHIPGLTDKMKGEIENTSNTSEGGAENE